MNKKTIIMLALAVVVVGGGYLVFSGGKPLEQLLPGLTPPPSAPSGGGGPAPAPSPTSSKPIPGVPVTSGGTVTVDIKGFAFVSSTTRIGPGTKIIWKNYDDVAHSVVGPTFQSKLLQKGESYSYTFNQPGVYSYFCGSHPNMKGEIVVR
ncbi:MAG: plastocyanin/azurin family copper-binding protein [bacterium]|nr:plastocyanin/azurin family copper-binding protein [bacterium]